MSAARVVRAAPGFAGGRLALLNRLLRACAAAGGPARVTLLLDERPAGDDDLVLRMQNAHGDPVGLPAPHRGEFRDTREREMFAAAVRDLALPAPGLGKMVKDFLPQPRTGLLAAAVELWPRLLPGLTVLRAEDGAPADEGAPAPPLVWVGAPARRTLDDLGISARELLTIEREHSEKYRPALAGELASGLERADALWLEELGRLRALAAEVDPSLFGSWSRMERSVRRGLGEFRAAAERCLDNHAGIRRSRWHTLYQQLRPAGRAQEEGYSVLMGCGQIGIPVPIPAVLWQCLPEFTSAEPSDAPQILFLDS